MKKNQTLINTTAVAIFLVIFAVIFWWPVPAIDTPTENERLHEIKKGGNRGERWVVSPTPVKLDSFEQEQAADSFSDYARFALVAVLDAEAVGDKAKSDLWRTAYNEYAGAGPAERAMIDLRHLIGEQAATREKTAIKDALARGITGSDILKNRPASYATAEEQATDEALLRIFRNPSRVESHHFKTVSEFLTLARGTSLEAIESGNGRYDLDWHTQHVEWIEQTADDMNIPLDPENDNWITERMTEIESRVFRAERKTLAQVHQEIDESLQKEFGIIDPELLRPIPIEND